MADSLKAEPDNTAVRVALWRALHLSVDPAPHVFVDDLGAKLAAPEAGWQQRPDMHPQHTASFRASILGRARFVEDVIADDVLRGLGQYVILGAGLDTFVQRHPNLASRLQVFEVDQPVAQNWKRQRLMETGMGLAPNLHLVPVNFEAGDDWWQNIASAGFDAAKPVLVSSLGVSMYLTKEAIAATLRQAAALASGSTFIMSFLLPLEMADVHMRPILEFAVKGAAASGTPFISFFRPEEMLSLARDAGFKTVQHISAADITQRYFARRADGLQPPKNTEELLVATT